jgi:mRNA-degrading endonuclease RelE of RelBE toxin-antitoxin system
MAKLCLAKTFRPSLEKLSSKERAQAHDFVMMFMEDPSLPGISLERVTGGQRDSLWSGRITRDLRAIVFKDGDTWFLLYASHHDDAYHWASRRTGSRHAITGEIQIVETVETVREKIIEQYTLSVQETPLFEGRSNDYLLSLGVPESWLPTIREMRNDEELLQLASHLPEEVVERLLDLAVGKLVTPPTPIASNIPAEDGPVGKSHFYVVDGPNGLQAALNASMEEWIAFLHPSQREAVEREYKGPVKVTGSAGTGKTVVAMHRARYLASQGKKVLLTSYVSTLCHNIERNLALLCTEEELRNITVSTIHRQAFDIV